MGFRLRGNVSQSQGAMPGDMAKVSVGRQHREVVTDAKLRQQCVDEARDQVARARRALAVSASLSGSNRILIEPRCPAAFVFPACGGSLGMPAVLIVAGVLAALVLLGVAGTALAF